MEAEPVSTEKKPFNKKSYRYRKYSNKAKVDEWKKKRENYMHHKYKKLLRKEAKAGGSQPENEAEKRRPAHNRPWAKKQHKGGPKKKAGGTEDGDDTDAAAASRAEKEKEKQEARERMKAKKAKRSQVLGARTKKGQPLMGGRIELLLEKIQQQMQ